MKMRKLRGGLCRPQAQSYLSVKQSPPKSKKSWDLIQTTRSASSRTTLKAVIMSLNSMLRAIVCKKWPRRLNTRIILCKDMKSNVNEQFREKLKAKSAPLSNRDLKVSSNMQECCQLSGPDKPTTVTTKNRKVLINRYNELKITTLKSARSLSFSPKGRCPV